MRISLSQINSAVFISLSFIIICLLLPVKSYSAIATLYTQPSSGVAPLEVRLTCAVATDTSMPKSYTMDFGDGSEPIFVETNSYSQTFTHTYQGGLFKPICRVVKTDLGLNTETDPGNIIVAKWKFKTGGEIDTSPAIDDDGIIYLGSDDGKLYAVDPLAGNEIWRFQTGDQIKSSPAIGSDGTIYFGSTDNYFYAVRPNGELKWSFNIGDYIFSSPAISLDERTVYVGASDNHLYAISTSGGLKWKYLTGGKIVSSPAIGFDGIEDVVYFGSLDKKLYALAADNGVLKWTFSGNAEFYASPAIDQYGQIYVGECNTGSAEEYNFKFYSINVDGSKLWEFDGGTGFYSSPAIGPNGKIYVGSWDGYLVAFNRNGTPNWAIRTSPPLDINSSPAIDSNGIVYVGSKDGNFYAFESPEIEEEDRNDWVYQTNAPIIEASPAIGSDGTIYFASRDKCLYAVDPGLVQLADSSWPMFHAGTKHQGAVQEDIDIPTVISASPERNSINIDINVKTITVNFSPDIKDSQIDADSFQLIKINEDETEERIDGSAFLDYVRYNNSGYHMAAIFNRLNDDVPLEYLSEYKASISYLPKTESQVETLDEEASDSEVSEAETTTFSTTFTTAAEPEKDSDPSPKGDFSCFINSIR